MWPVTTITRAWLSSYWTKVPRLTLPLRMATLRFTSPPRRIKSVFDNDVQTNRSSLLTSNFFSLCVFECEQMDIATTLLEYGAQTNAESKAGFTPLHLSAQEGHTDMSTLLIEHQAEPNYVAKNGLTPMHLCAQEDRVNVAAILVKNNAEINVQTKVNIKLSFVSFLLLFIFAFFS